MLIIERCIINI